jgi:hypothetical protein
LLLKRLYDEALARGPQERIAHATLIEEAFRPPTPPVYSL